MDRQLLLAIAVFLGAICIVCPTADIPINDDWQYSHVTKTLAETGRIKIDVAIAPALVAQAALGAAYSRLVGFSHRNLRILTWIVAIVFLGVVNALLKLGHTSPTVRGITLLTLVLNPIFFHLANSFMTELYGYTPMFFGAWLWLSAVTRRETDPSPDWRRIAAAAIIGSTFWIRQFCVLAWPALVFSEILFGAPGQRRWKRRLRHQWPQLITTGFAFFSPIVLYSFWVRASGNLNPAFSDPLAWLFRFNCVPLFYHLPLAALYLTFFSLPLVVMSLGPLKKRRLLVIGSWMMAALIYIFIQGVDEPWPNEPLHRFFPFLGNIISPFGLGPVSLTDLYIQHTLPPYSNPIWASIGICLAVLCVRWLAGTKWSLPAGFSRFSGLYVALSFYIVVMAYRKDVFERYHFGIWIAVTVWLASRLQPDSRRLKLAVAGLILMGTYTVLGSFDYFRWQEARWELTEQALRRGIAVSELDGGYETNGWLASQHGWAADCGIAEHFFCPHRRFAIVATVQTSDRVISTLKPRQILFPITTLHLVERHI